MDKLSTKQKNKGGVIQKARSKISEALLSRKENAEEAFFDISAALIAFFFARCHLIFGAHPLAVAFVAVLPSRVWIALAGAVIGSLTLGKYGIIYAMITVIVVFLRIIVSGTDKRAADGTAPPVFSESLLLKMSSSVIGGFIAAVYEVLLSGFSFTSVLFGLSMILIPPVLVFALSGLFDGGVRFLDVISTDKPLLNLKGLGEKEKFNLIFFQASFCALVFLLSLSLKPYAFLGINVSLILASGLTLLLAKRFGALRGAGIGFIASFGISSSYAAAFALMGLVAGVLFRIGLVYALIGGGIALVSWCSYGGGISGIVATLPEYAITSALVCPLLRKLTPAKSEEQIEDTAKLASEMVGTMALSYKAKRSSSLDALSAALSSLSSIIRKQADLSARPKREELSELISECAAIYCSEGFEIDTAPLAEILYKNGKITPAELDLEDEREREGLCEAINRAAAFLAEEKYKASAKDTRADELDLISKLISEARDRAEREYASDRALSDKLDEIIESERLSSGVGRAFGDRIKHIIIAAEDEGGKRITSPSLLRSVEEAGNIKLTCPEYFRRGKMALMQASSAKAYTVECAYASAVGNREAVSGDTVMAREADDGHFYALISDGMGSGEEARESSQLVSSLLFSALDFGAGKQTLMKLLNSIMLSRGKECSATVDLFSFDLYSGEACFIKSGAAPSYIKRGEGGSIFRIRSRTAPLGLRRELDAERIKVELSGEDLIIMLSDGVSQSAEDSPWLLDLLSSPLGSKSLKEYAEQIISAAIKCSSASDDMTVCVARVIKIK